MSVSRLANGSKARATVAAVALTMGLFVGCGPMPFTLPPADPTAEVYLIRGLFDVFSLGLDDLGEKLNAQGVEAAVLSGPAWKTLVDELRQRPDAGPLILIGHSYGADDAVRVARRLRDAGTPVALLILIDATRPDPIPANVERCVHVYLPSALGEMLPGVFSGNPVEPEEGNTTTEIVNQLVTVDELGPEAAAIDHFNIEASDLIHDLAIAEIQSTLASAYD